MVNVPARHNVERLEARDTRAARANLEPPAASGILLGNEPIC